MCCQIHVDEETEALLSEKFNSGITLEKGLIKPNAKASLITQDGIRTMTWGFSSPKGTGLLINARSESTETKPSFRESFQKNRCIVPASFFYEYDHFKSRVEFSLFSTPLLFLAAIYTSEEGALRFTVLTTKANESMAPYHDRMPLLLKEDQLEPYLFDRKEASGLLKYPMPPLKARSESQQLEFSF